MPVWVPNTDCIVSWDITTGGALTNYSDEVSTVTLDTTTNIGGFYTFGLSGEQTSEGQRTHTSSIGVRPATDAGSAHNVLTAWTLPGAGNKSGARSIRIQAPDATTGSFQYDFEAYCDSYNQIAQDASGDGSPATHTASLRVDGDVTLTVIT